jgi:hypothetical protein
LLAAAGPSEDPNLRIPFPLICSLLSGLRRSLTVSTVPVAPSISETREKCGGFRSLSYDRFCFLYMAGSHDPKGPWSMINVVPPNTSDSIKYTSGFGSGGEQKRKLNCQIDHCFFYYTYVFLYIFQFLRMGFKLFMIVI